MIKVLKASLLVLAGSMALLIAWTNWRYPASNRAYISHTLAMDTTINGPHRQRAIFSICAVEMAFYLVTAAEAITGALCLLGGLLYPFTDAGRIIGLTGLTSGLFVWFGGFRVIAAEYFFGWQSKEWNGEPDASRIATILGVIWLIIK